MRRSAPLLASPHAHTIAGIAALPRLLADRRLPCLFPVLLQGTLSFREFSGGFLRRHQTKNEPLPMDEFKAQAPLNKVTDQLELERRLQHPRQKTDHELMAARPLNARGSRGALAAAARVHSSKGSKHSGAPFR